MEKLRELRLSGTSSSRVIGAPGASFEVATTPGLPFTFTCTSPFARVSCSVTCTLKLRDSVEIVAREDSSMKRSTPIVQSYASFVERNTSLQLLTAACGGALHPPSRSNVTRV